MMFENLNKELKTVKINLSEILTAEKNHITDTLYDKNISYDYDEEENRIAIRIEANNKNYIIKCDKIIHDFNNININLSGNKNGNLIVINNKDYICYAFRRNKGNGHIILSGSGEGCVFREGNGHGHAIRIGYGEGDAYRCDQGNGHALRLGSGDGRAYRYDVGHGLAVRLGAGKGYASNDRYR